MVDNPRQGWEYNIKFSPPPDMLRGQSAPEAYGEFTICSGSAATFMLERFTPEGLLVLTLPSLLTQPGRDVWLGPGTVWQPYW